MKKGVLISVTGVFILLSYIVSLVIIMQVPVVDVFTVTTQGVESTVVCSGKFEYAGDHTVKSQYIGEIAAIYVSEGDNVSKGDKLCSITAGTNSISETSGNLSSSEELALAQSVLNGDATALDNYTGDGIVLPNDSAVGSIDIFSDYSGIVSEIMTKEGQLLENGDEILNISESENMQIQLDVGEDKIGEIEPGQKVDISCNAVKDNEINGTVSKIGRSAKQTTTALGKLTTVDVIVSVESELPTDIKSGYTAKCSIIVDSKDDAILLPYEAVSYDQNGDVYVMCYSESGNCIKKNIITGKEYKNGVEVISGVKKGEILLSSSSGVDDSTFAKAEVESDD